MSLRFSRASHNRCAHTQTHTSINQYRADMSVPASTSQNTHPHTHIRDIRLQIWRINQLCVPWHALHTPHTHAPHYRFGFSFIATFQTENTFWKPNGRYQTESWCIPHDKTLQCVYLSLQVNNKTTAPSPIICTYYSGDSIFRVLFMSQLQICM